MSTSLVLDKLTTRMTVFRLPFTWNTDLNLRSLNCGWVHAQVGDWRFANAILQADTVIMNRQSVFMGVMGGIECKMCCPPGYKES